MNATAFRTSVSGRGDRYPDPDSQFLASEDNYVLLIFHQEPLALVVDLKALDGPSWTERAALAAHLEYGKMSRGGGLKAEGLGL